MDNSYKDYIRQVLKSFKKEIFPFIGTIETNDSSKFDLYDSFNDGFDEIYENICYLLRNIDEL